MAVTSKSQEQHRISPEAAMLGVLALLIDEREQRIGNDKGAEEPKCYSPASASRWTTSLPPWGRSGMRSA